MKIARLHRNLLFYSVALALAAPLPGLAQEQAATAGTETPADVDTLDTVVVTGVRGSLARAIELKREAGTVQDFISALELGKFPDDNVADSLSHITGVSISAQPVAKARSKRARPGSGVHANHLQRPHPATDGAGRDFAYDVLPADVISGADVVKGAQASLSEGAIGGLINLRSASPFDQDGQQGVIRLEGDRNQMSELNGHKFSATYSNLFADDTLGVLLGVVYGKRKDRTDIAGNDGGWSRNADPNDESWLWGNTWAAPSTQTATACWMKTSTA